VIFEVLPAQVESLNSQELIELLRRLLHSEAQLAGVNLSAVSVPMQITVADGGEDARIKWDGGMEKTDYLPNRFTIFQAKATDPGKAGWMKEVWSKATVKRRKARRKKKGAQSRLRMKAPRPKLNQAVATILDARGAYVGFTSAALVGSKPAAYADAIRDGIKKAGKDPRKIATIEVYDANKIAAWASRHPAVALWVNEGRSGLALGGFQTIRNWGGRDDVKTVALVNDTAARYVLGGQLVDEFEKEPAVGNVLTAQQATERIFQHVSESQASVRLFGPSGVGKTRFVYELIRRADSVGKTALGTSAIYCDYRAVGQTLLEVATTITRLGVPATIIADECPLEVAQQLDEIVRVPNGRLRLLTIDLGDTPLRRAGCLNMAVRPGDDSLIDGIVRARLPNATNPEVEYVRNLCGGFPRIAVLATDSYSQRSAVLGSIGDVVDRILEGGGITDRDDLRAIETLALFDRLGFEGEVSSEIDYVAEHLLETSGDRMYESLARASREQLVDRRSRYVSAQPFPIAAYIGLRRLDLMRPASLLRFIGAAPEGLLASMFRKWRFFDSSRVATKVAEHLTGPEGKFGSQESLLTSFGAECIDMLTHLVPDAAIDTLQRTLGALSIEELERVERPRRPIVSALEKLVFRSRSFAAAARLLLKLAAAENERWSNNATGQFIQLFQLQLCGTEVAPDQRFAVLDEALVSADQRIVDVCLEALQRTLGTHHFTRLGDIEKLGSRPPLKDWAPTEWRQVFDFHRGGLTRLMKLRGEKKALAERCEKIIASHLRGLLHPEMFNDIEELIDQITKENGIWLEAIEALGDWLYFDRKGAPTEFSKKVRDLYGRLLPTDPITAALFYTKFWPGDIRDPDKEYETTDGDFDYSTRQARKVAAEIANDAEQTRKAVRTMAALELHNVFPFAHELASRSGDPEAVFALTLEVFSASAEKRHTQFIRGVLSAIDARDKQMADRCVQLALDSHAFDGQTVNLYTAVSMTPQRINEIVGTLRDGRLTSGECAFLSYGRGLDGLIPTQFAPLLDELEKNHGAQGRWTVLEIISMYLHGRPQTDATLVDFIKRVTTSEDLLTGTRQANRDGYLFERLVERIQKQGQIDEEYARNLSSQIVRLCQINDYAVFSALDDAVRKTVRLLANDHPAAIWEPLARFFEIATPIERHQLENLTGPPRGNVTLAGPLFGIPEDLVANWVASDPAHRVSFPLQFFPLFDDGGNGPVWHSSIERLASRFGHVTEFLDSVARRLYPRSWSGSLVPYLRSYLRPLESWFNHGVPEVAQWARDAYRSMERQIEREIERDKENER
jgi:hypothetical protein